MRIRYQHFVGRLTLLFTKTIPNILHPCHVLSEHIFEMLNPWRSKRRRENPSCQHVGLPDVPGKNRDESRLETLSSYKNHAEVERVRLGGAAS